MSEIDRPRVERLSEYMMEAIVANFREGPTSRDRVFEALNALSFAVASVIVGASASATEERQVAKAFFSAALATNIIDLTRFPPPPLT